MWTVCITSIRHVLKLNGYGGRQAKANEKRQRFKGWETLVISLTKRFRDDESDHQDWLIIGTDYAGNPIGINKEGKVLLQDYDYGELNVLGESFEDYILKSLDS